MIKAIQISQKPVKALGSVGGHSQGSFVICVCGCDSSAIPRTDDV